MSSVQVWNKSSNATLWARWQEAQTVTLNRNGGLGGTASIQAVMGQVMPMATAPSRDGHVFDGYWDTQLPTGGLQYYGRQMQSIRNWNIPRNTTLWARWINTRFEADKSAFGIYVDPNFVPVGSTSFYQTPLIAWEVPGLDVAKRTSFHTSLQYVLLRDVRVTNSYIFVYRVGMQPQNNKQYGGIEWLNYSQDTRAWLPNTAHINQYAPQNLPGTTSGTIGVSGGTSGLDVSASIDWTKDELNIWSSTNLATRLFATHYEYRKVGEMDYSTYLRGTVFSYGMIAFTSNLSSFNIPLEFEMSFRDNFATKKWIFWPFTYEWQYWVVTGRLTYNLARGIVSQELILREEVSDEQYE
jgi:hypothetical protein